VSIPAPVQIKQSGSAMQVSANTALTKDRNAAIAEKTIAV